MKTRRIGLVVALVAAWAWASATPAQAAPACGTTITTSITLDANVGPCAGNGLIVGANNITINLNGFAVLGDSNSAAAQNGIRGVGRSGVTVRNGTVSGFDSGVYIESGTGWRVSEMVLRDNIGPLDLSSVYGEGLQIYLGGGHTIFNNRVIHNGPYAGIVAYQSSNNVIDRNTVTDNNVKASAVNTDIGIWVVNLNANLPLAATNNRVTFNTVSNSGLDGIQIARYTNNNFVASNRVTNSGRTQVPDVRNGDGIVIFGNGNTVQYNQATYNGRHGISVQATQGQGTGNVLRYNTAYVSALGNNSAGIGFDLFDGHVAPPCDSNTWANNSHQTKSQACIA